MGSGNIQGPLWGRRPQDWSTIQEQTSLPGYQYVLKLLQLTPADQVLDAGCGSGVFCDLAQATGATVTGIDASEPLLAIAKKRNSRVQFLSADLEALPFADKAFSVITGCNSFQYAASIKNALAEARRVLADDGKLSLMIWGNKEDCEAATYLKAVGSMLPPPPPGAPGPFALSENHLLETFLTDNGFQIIDQTDVDSIWDYPDTDTALRGLLSAGPAAKAIDHSGYDKVRDAVLQSFRPYTQQNGHVIFRNKFRIVTSIKK